MKHSLHVACTDVCAQMSLLILSPQELRDVLWWIDIFPLSGGTHFWEALDLCLHFLSALIASRWEVFLGARLGTLIKNTFPIDTFGLILTGLDKEKKSHVWPDVTGKQGWLLWPCCSGVVKQQNLKSESGSMLCIWFSLFFYMKPLGAATRDEVIQPVTAKPNILPPPQRWGQLKKGSRWKVDARFSLFLLEVSKCWRNENTPGWFG